MQLRIYMNLPMLNFSVCLFPIMYPVLLSFPGRSLESFVVFCSFVSGLSLPSLNSHDIQHNIYPTKKGSWCKMSWSCDYLEFSGLRMVFQEKVVIFSAYLLNSRERSRICASFHCEFASALLKQLKEGKRWSASSLAKLLPWQGALRASAQWNHATSTVADRSEGSNGEWHERIGLCCFLNFILTFG